jgi:16S rRNA (cytosine1402-N4)-methyltransferase
LKKFYREGINLEFNHKSVMLQECIDGLNIKPDGIYVDGTMGGAGHSKEIVKRISKNGLLVGIDRDEEAICVAKERLKEFPNVQFIHDNHDNIKEILENLNIPKVDGILLDLGVSSYQLDERNRGFSYMGEGDLDMRMDQTQSLTAKDVVNNYSEEDLAKIIFEYGEEKFSRAISRKILEKRKEKKIETTDELVKIIEEVIPRRKGEGHPAKRTFQAIRIEVNNKFNRVLKKWWKIMCFNFSLIRR